MSKLKTILSLLILAVLVMSGIAYSTEATDTTTTDVEEISCADSDGGLNYNIKGTISGINPKTNANAIIDDVCTLGGSLTGSCAAGPTCAVAEYTCGDNGFIVTSTYVCPNGCKDGACVGNICTDSDGGQNFAVKGTTSGLAGEGVYTTDTDMCDGNLLIEWFCSGAYRANTNYNCPNGCSDGACLLSTCTLQNGACCRGSVCTGADIMCTSDSYPVISGCDANCVPIAECKPYGTACAKTGETVFITSDFGPTSCCSKIDGIKPNSYLTADGRCIATTNGAKGVCTSYWDRTCGDGKCDASKEDKCSCSKDCSTPVTCEEPICENGPAYDTGKRYADGCPIYKCPQNECKAIFSSCSCSYKCIEIDPSRSIIDCARVCEKGEMASYVPSCGYVNGVCQDLNVKPACKSYTDERGCTVTKCSDGTETIDCSGTPYGKYVKLNEKFGLVQGQSAKVTDYGYMKLTLNNWMCTGACPESAPCDVSCGISLTAEMPAKCEIETSTSTQSSSGCTSTGTQISLSEGQSEEVFGAKVSYLAKKGQEAILIVQNPSTNEGGVDIEIYPAEQTISYGDKAVYKVTVTDKHSKPKCLNPSPGEAACMLARNTYFIDVRNLPFLKEYPKQVQLVAGESTTFDLIVRPYVIATKEEVAEGAVTEPSPSTEYAESASSSTSGGISAATGSIIAKPAKTEAVMVKQAVSVAETAVAVESTEQAIPAEATAESPIEVTEDSMMYRAYKFNVRVMQKDDPRNQDIAYAMLSIKPVEPPVPRPPEFPGEEVGIKLYKGWNLISLPGKLVKFESIGLDKKLVGFVYIKEEQRYASLSEAKRILGGKFNAYLARNAFWVYSYNNIELKVKIDRELSYNDIDLKKGWNLVPITQDMLGGYLSDIKGDCEFEKLYLWDAAGQSWKKISESYQFSDSLLNYGFLIKTKEDCRLGGAVVAIAPPAMPE